MASDSKNVAEVVRLRDGPSDSGCKKHDYLRRLPPEFYRGQAYVHWSMAMDDRKTGWLIPIFYYKFREVLTHTMFRYGLCCPIYCCMSDHIHLLWLGIAEGSDQRSAAKYFRVQLNPVLEKLGARFQSQPYDHVLREEERERSAFENVVEYIARNPERAGLVPVDKFRVYQVHGLPGPRLSGIDSLAGRLLGLVLATLRAPARRRPRKVLLKPVAEVVRLRTSHRLKSHDFSYVSLRRRKGALDRQRDLRLCWKQTHSGRGMNMAHVEAEAIAWTAADLVERLGAIPLVRIRQFPAPGTAVEQDAIDINERKVGLCELIDGVLVEKTAGMYESYLAVLIGSSLHAAVTEHKLGFVLGSDGMTRLEPGQIRVPDAAFYSWSRFPDRRVPRTAYVDTAPDLAVEVISPSNTRQEMDRKLSDYFVGGTRLVWYIYPNRREVVVYHSLADQKVLPDTDELDGENVLPRFRLNLAEFFAEP